MTLSAGLKNTDAVGESGFLGVDKSLTGKRWVNREADSRQSLAVAQRLDLPEIVGRVMVARGVGLDDAAGFLNPTLKGMLPDPSCLIAMDDAAERLGQAVMAGETIAIFGDYDVDGATSGALLKRFFSAAGGKTTSYIPDRIKEGYGPNTQALMKLKADGAAIVVTVDCGTMAYEPLETAAAEGLEVIVVDHHQAEAKLPPARAIINPNRMDDESGLGQLAAVGVAFMLAIAVNRSLRVAGWYKDHQEPDLTQWLDLVALGTVCDVVPLTGLNRALVAQGLKVMAGRRNPGLSALADVAGLSEAPGTYHAGFVLGPRINAGGRIGASELGTRLLATDDATEAMEIAHRLDALNKERKGIEAAVQDAAMADAEQAGVDLGPVVIAAGVGWHPGVIGIVASRLKERFNRPACVVALDGDTGTGSGRSVSGVDLGSAIIAACQAGILIKGGGHKMAAGFTVEKKRLGDLQAFLNDRVTDQVGERGIQPRLYLDGALKPSAATMELLERLEQVGPFGSGNPEPRFVIPAARLSYSAIVGDKHVRGTVEGEGQGKKKGRLQAISFNTVGTALGSALLGSDGAPLHIAGRLRVNSWQGRSSAQLHIDDAAPAW